MPDGDGALRCSNDWHVFGHGSPSSNCWLPDHLIQKFLDLLPILRSAIVFAEAEPLQRAT